MELPLRHFSAVYVPTPAHLGRNILFLARMEGAMCSLFGGCTTINGIGSWVNPKTGNVIKEPMAIVTSYHDGQSAAKLQRVRQLCHNLARDANQICIAMVHDNVLEFVTGE